jgi:putative transposase
VPWARRIGYTSFVNARARWNGHLLQGRHASVAMDEAHLIAAVRYVSLNPVRAGLVSRAQDWAWSSVRAHLNGVDDDLVRVRSVLDRVERFGELIADGAEAGQRYDGALQALLSSQTTGRPLGAPDFVEDLERRLGRKLARRGRGRKSESVSRETGELVLRERSHRDGVHLTRPLIPHFILRRSRIVHLEQRKDDEQG